jgi:type IV pilus assembly protein PilW
MKPTVKLKSTGRAASRGLTILELLVSVTIGLLLTVVIAQLFLNSRQTFATTDDMSRLQENVRFTQQLLTRSIHVAGYKSQPNSVTATVFSGNPVIASTPGTSPTDPDSLTIRFQGSRGLTGTADGYVLDCLGVEIDAGVMAVNTFFIGDGIGGRPMGLNGRPALFCNNGTTIAELVPDVANMQVLFGEDTDADLTANRYVEVPNMSNVVSVRIALMFTTPNDFVKTAVDNRTYEMLSTDPAALLGPYLDRRIRRVVVTTVNLRNRTP